MTKQAENFANLVKGSPISSVQKALKSVNKKVYNELAEKTGQDSIEGLATALSIGV